jgi:hypothetical protein
MLPVLTMILLEIQSSQVLAASDHFVLSFPRHMREYTQYISAVILSGAIVDQTSRGSHKLQV